MNKYITLSALSFPLLVIVLAGCAKIVTPNTDVSPIESVNPVAPIAAPSNAESMEEIEQNPFAHVFFETNYVDEYEQVFYKKIAPDLPEFQFALHGYFGEDDDGISATTINKIEISEIGGEHIQTIDSLCTFLPWMPLSDTDFSFDDWNNDGYMDISLFDIPGGTMGNRPTCFWLWDNQTKHFVKCKELGELSDGCRVTLEDDGSIRTFTRLNPTYVEGYYQFEANELVLVEEHELSFE